MPRPDRSKTFTLSWRKKLLFAAITTVLFFVALEAILACCGIGPVTDGGDPFIGFSRRLPLFVSDSDQTGGTMLTTAPARRVWFNPQSFPAEKPPGTRRIFCLGGSTTFGRPFSDATSYCGWLRELLPAVDSSCKWEVINAGGVSYASYRVAAIMEELTRYEPDLFIVYSAHNEFLERRTYASMFDQPQWKRDLVARLQKTRTWSMVDRAIGALKPDKRAATVTKLPEDVDEMLNHSIGPSDYHRDDTWHAGVLQHYRWNLARMVSMARDCGADVILITPASNLRDCWPFKSESAEGLSDESIGQQTEQLRLVRERLEDEQYEAALEICRKILTLDPRHAEARYHAGRALFGLNRFEEAAESFQRAIDEDICPLRATTQIDEAVRDVARQHDVPVVDFHQRLSAKCQREQGHRCLGSEYFLDHVHPTVDVHRELALWIIDRLQDEALLGGSAPTDETLQRVTRRVESRLDTETQALAFRNLAKVMHWAGKFHEAAAHASNAIQLAPHDLESRFVLADCLTNMGRRDEALQQYTELFTIDEYLRAYLPYGELLAEDGDFGAAKSYLMQALMTENRENRARAHYMLGLVHYELGEYEFAAQSLEAADELYPNNVSTLMWLSEARLSAGDVDAAIESLRETISLDNNHFAAHYKLGVTLLSIDDKSGARRHIKRALEIRPDSEQAADVLQTIETLLSSSR